MGWVLIILSVVVLWFASLCKVLHFSWLSSKSTFLNDAGWWPWSVFGGAFSKKNVLLVIAHPDDESMFFSPTINHLISLKNNVHVLCMSIGNADGIGNIRKEELYKASAVLKIPLHQVKILDHPDFQDGFGKVWNSNLLASIVQEEILTHHIEVIITFDSYGVSGHCNHQDVYLGVRMLLHGFAERKIEAWEVVSNNILRKYSGPVEIWLSMWYAYHHPNQQIQCLLNKHPRRSYVAMSQHKSQWVWFRKLFVLFSSFTYVNTLRKVNYV